MSAGKRALIRIAYCIRSFIYKNQTVEYVSSMVFFYNKTGRNIKIEHGLEGAFDNGFSFEQLTDLMFFIAIQEDINYPEVRYQGRIMCFYRYWC